MRAPALMRKVFVEQGGCFLIVPRWAARAVETRPHAKVPKPPKRPGLDTGIYHDGPLGYVVCLDRLRLPARKLGFVRVFKV